MAASLNAWRTDSGLSNQQANAEVTGWVGYGIASVIPGEDRRHTKEPDMQTGIARIGHYGQESGCVNSNPVDYKCSDMLY